MRRLALLGILFLAAACGRLRPGSEADVARVVFTNDALEQASVYATLQGGGDGNRIGTVMAGRTDTLRIPPAFVGRGNVVIVARLLARRGAPNSGPIPIGRGTVIHVRMPTDGRSLIVLPGNEPF